MSATATTNPQEINGSVPFRRCLPLRGTVNMTEKEIREAVKNKENYSSIVTYFKTQKTLSEADLALLIDMIERCLRRSMSITERSRTCSVKA